MSERNRHRKRAKRTTGNRRAREDTDPRTNGAPGNGPDVVPQAHVGALLRGGVHGHRGGFGRPPAEFKSWLGELRNSPKAREAREAAACDPNSRSFSVAWRILTEYDPDRPRGDDTDHKAVIQVFGPPTGLERPIESE
jgi:hypothetical protein